MRRAKKGKSKQYKKPDIQTIQKTNHLHLAIIVRTLWMVYGWRHEQLGEFLEAYLSLFAELADRRTTIKEFVEDTTELTNIDVVRLLDEIMKLEDD